MKRIATLAGCALFALGNTALAQEAASIVEGPGYKVGEGSVLHPTVGLETGIVSNVFRSSGDTMDDETVTAGLLRVLAQFGIASLPPQRLEVEPGLEDEGSEGPMEAPKLEFRADLALDYNEYLSGNENVRAQRDLGIGANGRIVAFPEGTASFSLTDHFRREIRPTNFESSESLDRDINHLILAMKYQPGGRALTGELRYENVIDVFESSDSSFANRLQNTFGLRVNWQWLPITRFYADASIGIFTGLGSDSEKISSYPLRLLVGTQTALTVNTTLAARVGFGKGFYTERDDFTNAIFGAELGYRYSPFGRILFLYDYDFQDSINANFYRDHAFKVSVDQQIVLVTLQAAVEARLRRYRGVIINDVDGMTSDRDDTIISVTAGARYNFRDWLAATADYTFISDQTDFRYEVTSMGAVTQDNPSYNYHLFLVGVRAAF
jgi:hypothetical protein